MPIAGSEEHRPTLLYVVNVSWFFISHRLALAVAAGAMGYGVHVATQVCSDDERKQIVDAGIVVYDLDIPRSALGPWKNLALLWRLIVLYRRIRPDIVHHVTMKPNVLGGWAARMTGVPGVVYAISGLGSVFAGEGIVAGLRQGVLKWVMHSALAHRNSRVIFQNPDDAHTLTRAGVVNSDRAVLIRGAGVDLADYSMAPEPSGVVTVLFASRLLREKGVAEFVAAARSLRAAGVQARFLLAGKVDEENPGSFTEAEVLAWDAAGIIQWLGYVSPIARILADVNIVALPSYYGEGIPKVLIEAAAAGRAIVTTDMPGCREIVKHEFNGLLVPPRDVAALASALRRLVEHPADRLRMGLAGREHVAAAYTLKQVVEQTLQVYRTLTVVQGS